MGSDALWLGTAGLAKSNGSLPPGGWLQVTCGLTTYTPGSAPGPTLGNEYGRTLPFFTPDSTHQPLNLNLGGKGHLPTRRTLLTE